VVGATSYQYLVDNVEPMDEPLVFDTLHANIAALKNGQVDGLVTDFATAYYIANVQLSNAKLVGRFPTVGSQEYVGLTFEKGNSLVGCVNKAIASLKAYNLFLHRTVLANVTLAPRKVLGVPKEEAEEAARSLLARFGLQDKQAEYPDRLSGGQQQRAASCARSP